MTTIDPGQGYQKQSKVEQTLDAYGNLTQMKEYGYASLTTPVRTFNNTYLTGPEYSSRYIFNRLVTASVTDGTNNVTLLTNTSSTLTQATRRCTLRRARSTSTTGRP